MHEFEIEQALSNMVLLIDTREQITSRLEERLESAGLPWIRQKLDFGDYSAKCDLYDLSREVVIERKMNLDELAMCFGTQRKRFEREFLRAQEAGAKVYLLVENASWDVLHSEDSYKMRCHSRYSAKAMIASLTAWMARYNMRVIFCNEHNSGKLIKQILFREMKEKLHGLDKD